MKKKNLIKIKTKQSSDSSSEMSVDNNSEQESYSFIIQKRRKNKRLISKQDHFIETSPNNRFSRLEEKKYSDKHLVSYVGLDHDRGCDVVWNVIHITILSHEQKEKLFTEFLKLKDLKHENINTISEVWLKDENSLVFITDSFFGGSIRQYLYKIGMQKLKVIKSWLKMILLGLDYLHKNGLIYRDLNCGRIYYNNNNGVVSIGDVYVASPVFYDSFKENEYDTFPPNCMSTEIINNQQISFKSDIYSLGMVLIEMITIEKPYSDSNLSNVGIIQKIKDGVRPSILDRITDQATKEFISKLIDPSPAKRPTIAVLLEDEYLKINDKEDNRKIKLIKIKKRKRKTITNRDRENLETLSKDQLNCYDKINIDLFKRDFEENPYFEETLKQDKNVTESCSIEKLTVVKVAHRKKSEIKQERKLSKAIKNSLTQNVGNIRDKKESTVLQQVVTSSHEGGTHCYSDVYHTNTDYFNTNLNSNNLVRIGSEVMSVNTTYNNQNNIIKKVPSHINLIRTDESSDKLKHSGQIQNRNSGHSAPPYQIFDANYNVHLKFLISQDGNFHEIQFTYNLIRDNIPDLMEEIQNEFNFSQDNLNHIYETLKKISIYSKFHKNSDILHDNSI